MISKRKFDRIKREVFEGVARDTGRPIEDIYEMVKGKQAMTYDVTASLVDRDSDLHWGDFQR